MLNVITLLMTMELKPITSIILNIQKLMVKLTKQDIAESGHSPEDIIFIGSEQTGHSCTWEEFVKLADFVYYDGFGSQGIATDLIIAFSDGGKMWRHEYDGSEWWDYSRPFKMPEEKKPIVSLGGDEFMWDDLAAIKKDNAQAESSAVAD